jgi:uncharacterized protein (DUF488 family)
MDNSPLIFTIGHSNHDLEYFLSLLNQHQIGAVADVRSSPFSKFRPHFNKQSLMASLSNQGIKYVFLGDELGARRSEPECYRDSKVDYSLVANLTSFQCGLERLAIGCKTIRIALMCAEKDPLTCHRSILVARHLQTRPSQILHILANGKIENHADSEQRLLLECNLAEPDLFVSDQERLQLAYEIRANQIAYTESANMET